MYEFAKRTGREVLNFLRNRGGNTAVVFGLAMIPLLITIGASLDISRSLVVRARLSEALDAAGLAIGSAINLEEEDMEELARRFFDANYPEEELGVVGNINVRVERNVIMLSADATVPTTLMGIVGIHEVDVAVNSEITRENSGLEVALVLDNTGSMLSNDKIGALRRASRELIDILFGDDPNPELLRVSLVPFVTGVNIRSPGSFSWDWIDVDAESEYHGENFDLQDGERVSHLDLFDAMGVDWRGCVESRPYPYDVRDDAPSAANPDTLFVPYFWPDEPDDGWEYTNNYLDDNWADGDEEVCEEPDPVLTCTRYHRRWGYCQRWEYVTPESDCDDDDDGDWGYGGWGGYAYGGSGGSYNPTDEELQMNLNKYFDNPDPDIDETPSNTSGPNKSCPRPIVPLTNDRDFLLDEIDAMEPYNNSGTHISHGLSWGWRVLSPGEPYTQGAAYDDPDSSKALILLTDGENTMCCQSSRNGSDYTSYGYAEMGRLGTTSAYYGAQEIDDRVEELCENINAAGIRVYTITFRVSDSGLQNLFRGCASSPELYFDSPSNADLDRVFQAIGRDLSNLRISG